MVPNRFDLKSKKKVKTNPNYLCLVEMDCLESRLQTDTIENVTIFVSSKSDLFILRFMWNKNEQ